MSYLARLKEKNSHSYRVAVPKVSKGVKSPVLVAFDTFVTPLPKVCEKVFPPDRNRNSGDKSHTTLLIENACQGLTITPEQLRDELEQGGDFPDLISGELSIRGLRLAAETLSLTRYRTQTETRHSVNCGDCQHFQRIQHSHLRHCSKGKPEAPAGLWDTDARSCDIFEATTSE